MFPSIRTLKSLHSLTGAGSHLIFVSRSCLAYPSVTSALVVWLQQFEISHHYSRETGGSRPPAGQIYRARLELLAVACGAEPILFQGERISVSLGSHLFGASLIHPTNISTWLVNS